MFKLLTFVILSLSILSCSKTFEDQDNKGSSKMGIIDQKIQDEIIKELITKFGDTFKMRIERGVKQTASFWMAKDGTSDDFKKFCLENFLGTDTDLDAAFKTIQDNNEIMSGYFNKMNMGLKFPVQVKTSPANTPLELMFASYDPSAHVADDYFDSKIGFVITLNFPFYSLDEKNELGKNWTRKQWAYARVGDMITSRVPADLLQEYSKINTMTDQYISEYNIMMGYLVDDSGKTYFPKDMKLITHWNLRDEIKANYPISDGLAKQKMIYEVMKRIISQEIPQNVINSDKYTWNPVSNKVFENGKAIALKPEPNTRYQWLLDNFKALKAIDAYSPNYPTYIDRKFNQEMEMTFNDVEKLFTDFVSAPEVKQVGALMQKRLGRTLEPFDIWYDGFKPRSTMNQDELSTSTRAKYPNTDAFHSDMVRILTTLGFTKDKAEFLSQNIAVDNSRGAGHASGALIKGDKARLRTRIGEGGMDYKGYNIAVHEFGHNVEQTITLNDVDYYMLAGVPNTAFTEAMAFVFQSRDLTLLGKKNSDPNVEHLAALDNFLSSYEIMGVALVDMKVWKWLYANPNATAEQLKQEVIRTSKEVWNKYYAEVFGSKDQTILGIYSHMISYPLYLAAYPIGHLIEFSVEKQVAGKNLATELQRLLTQGKITPMHWMIGASGSPLSGKATLDAVDNALKAVK